jgi:tellurite resistance protein
MFSALKNLLTSGANKVAGKTDYLEGTTAICALVAAADGSIDDSEYEAAVNTIKANKTLGGAFPEHQISARLERDFDKAKTRPGRLELKREIAEVKDFDSKEMALMTALEVADQGGISDDEMKVLKECAGIFGLDLNKYL